MPCGIRFLLILTQCALFYLSVTPFAAAALPIPVGLSDCEFRDAKFPSQPLKVWTYRPQHYSADDPIVFVMHGMNRNGETYRKPWVSVADEKPCLIVVPEFPLEHFESSSLYQFGNLRTNRQWNDESCWTFSVIERLFDQVREATGSTRDGYYIFGHSAGAQFLHRMALFSSKPRAEMILAANAGSYTMPNFDVKYPYGLGESLLRPEDMHERWRRPLVILLGENDTDPNDPNLPGAPEARAQGEHRFARGSNFFANAQAAAPAEELKWRLVTVPGSGHSNVRMAPAAVKLIWDHEAGRLNAN